MRRLAVLLALLLVGPASAADPVAALSREVPDPRATVVLVHGGGWLGPWKKGTHDIDALAGPALTAAGYRTVSVDYRAGRAGLQDVRAAVAAVTGPVCLYGESAGGHLALLAAAAEGADCVVVAGAPVDLRAFHVPGLLSATPADADVIGQFLLVMGGGIDGFNPVDEPALPGSLHYVAQDGDPYVPASQGAALATAVPTTEVSVVPSGDETWLHGTIGAAGRAQLLETITGTVDRAVRGATADERLSRRCPGAGTEIRTSDTVGGLSCLLRRRTECPGRRATVRIRGAVTPARIVAALPRKARRLCTALRAEVQLGAPTRARVRLR